MEINSIDNSIWYLFHLPNIISYPYHKVNIISQKRMNVILFQCSCGWISHDRLGSGHEPHHGRQWSLGWDTRGAYFGIPQQNFWGWWLTVFTTFALYVFQRPDQEKNRNGTFLAVTTGRTIGLFGLRRKPRTALLSSAFLKNCWWNNTRLDGWFWWWTMLLTIRALLLWQLWVYLNIGSWSFGCHRIAQI